MTVNEMVVHQISRCVGRENIAPFSQWAFGPEYRGSKIQHLPRHWNERHGSLFVLEGTGRIESDVERMTLAWIQAGAAGAIAPMPVRPPLDPAPAWRSSVARILYVSLLVIFICAVIGLCWLEFNPNV